MELANCSYSSNEKENIIQTFNAPKPPLSLDDMNKGLQIAKTLETHFIKGKLSDCLSSHIFSISFLFIF